MKQKEVQIYTDGACSGNPGAGGYGAVLLYKGARKEIAQGYARTTNNRMELLAAIKALEALNEPCRVTLYSDSRYLVDGITKGWAEKWRKSGWMRNKKEKALNPDLWEKLLELTTLHTVTLVWVKGHAENPENNRCDQLAREAIDAEERLEDGGYAPEG